MRAARAAGLLDAAIRLCLSLKVLFKPSSRQTSGHGGYPAPGWRSWAGPCRTTRPCAAGRVRWDGGPSADGALNLLVDSTGIRFLGDSDGRSSSLGHRAGASHCPAGECVHSVSGAQGASGHGAATFDIRAVKVISSREGDSPVLPDLLDEIPEDEQIGVVTASGVYDTRRCHSDIIERDVVPFEHSAGPVAAMPSLPIRKNSHS